MNDFTLAELGVFLGVVGGIFTSIVMTFQKSKCKKISCCGIKCDRELKPSDRPEDPNDPAPVVAPAPVAP
jgi:hypothetical protein